MTFDELERLVREAIDPKDIFGDDVEGNLERYLALCHPDRHPGAAKRADAVSNALRQFAHFTPEDVVAIARAEAVFQSASQPVEQAKTLPASIRSPKRAYVLLQRLAIGDVADVHLARAEGTDYVLKVARIPEAIHHLETETEAVATLLQAAGDRHHDLARQENLCRVLEAARPVYRDVSRSGLIEVLGEVSPIAIEAHGPTPPRSGGQDAGVDHRLVGLGDGPGSRGRCVGHAPFQDLGKPPHAGSAPPMRIARTSGEGRRIRWLTVFGGPTSIRHERQDQATWPRPF